MTRCFLKAPAGRKTLAGEDGERFTSAYVTRLEEKADQARQTVKEVAGGKITLTTIRKEATAAAETAARIAEDPKKAAEDAVVAVTRALGEWEKKTPEEKLDNIATRRSPTETTPIIAKRRSTRSLTMTTSFRSTASRTMKIQASGIQKNRSVREKFAL